MNFALSHTARALALFGLMGVALATAGVRSVEADGVTVYLGVVPAEIARASLTPHVGPARDAHGRPVGSGEAHHFVIALFDSATDARIENAEVTATLTARGQHASGQRLEPMRINDTVTYGAVFDVAAGIEHRLDVEIRIPGRERAVAASFRYRDPEGSTP